MKKPCLIFAMLLLSATCYGWSTNDYTNEDKAKVDAITVTGGNVGDVLTLQIDGTWIPAAPTGGSTGSGDVTGPASATDGNIAVFDGITGKLIKDGGAPPTDGADGEEVLIQVADGYIQWKYESDVTWTNLISTASLTGLQGVPGEDGTDGIDGYSVLSVDGVPGPGTGDDGDFCINRLVWDIYGPKTAGAWGSPTSLIGLQGEQGEAGPQGIQGVQGPQGIQGVAGVDGDDGTDGTDGYSVLAVWMLRIPGMVLMVIGMSARLPMIFMARKWRGMGTGL